MLPRIYAPAMDHRNASCHRTRCVGNHQRHRGVIRLRLIAHTYSRVSSLVARFFFPFEFLVVDQIQGQTIKVTFEEQSSTTKRGRRWDRPNYPQYWPVYRATAVALHCLALPYGRAHPRTRGLQDGRGRMDQIAERCDPSAVRE
jgi:hypothetical protein